jgi:hypothetical protein
VGLRAEVYELDGGRCVGCGAKLARGADAWSWQVHHVLKVQTMKARGLRPKWWRGAALAVLTCRKCHMAHEARTATIPLEKLPERVHRSVAILGPWAVDLLTRYHPPTNLDARRVSGSPREGGPSPHGQRATGEGASSHA